jgi:hypothetical protein
MHEGGIEFEMYIATSYVDMKNAPASSGSMVLGADSAAT